MKEVVCGAKVRDRLSGKQWEIRAKVVINATGMERMGDYKDYLTSTISTEYVGPFSDSIRLMDNPEARQMVQPSAGIHIILPGYYSPRSMGLLDPATSDGRVIFFLPWLGEKDACLVCSKLNLYVVCR